MQKVCEFPYTQAKTLWWQKVRTEESFLHKCVTKDVSKGLEV